MKGDFSRIRFNPAKQYTAVLEQQGRVALDADANEQCAIDAHLRETETTDVVGRWGAPVHEAGFAVTVQNNEIVIGAGRYYVDGLFCENAAATPYEAQPFLLNAATSTELLEQLVAAGSSATIRVFLEAWQRLVTALDDPCLREPALGQADTTARLQTVYRVVATLVAPRILPRPGPGIINPAETVGSADLTSAAGAGQGATVLPAPVASMTPCCQAMYSPTAAAHTGTMAAQTSGGTDACGCQPIPAAGYRGLENQLYRVEIHQAGSASTATFKWSRENGAVAVAIVSVSGADVTVASLGPDANLGFQVGQWVEIIDDTYLFGNPPNQPGRLYQIKNIVPSLNTITMTTSVLPVDLSRNPHLRRWDQVGTVVGANGVPLSGVWIDLENGIQVRFGAGDYLSGDYWTIPARAATGQIEWPPCASDGKIFQPPHSAQIRTAPLACIHYDSKARQPFTVDDCRLLFYPLTELTPPARPDALHVTKINWVNDDMMTLDVLVKNGLALTFDRVPDGPVTPANLVVAVETPIVFADRLTTNTLGDSSVATALTTGEALTPDAFAIELFTSTVPRSLFILDSSIAVDPKANTVTWSLPFGGQTSALQNEEILALNAALLAGMPEKWPGRARVRLIGKAVFAGTGTNRVFLDGEAFGQAALRADGTTPRIDLQLPSGNDTKGADFDSWFYLYPTLAVASAQVTYTALTVTQAGGVVKVTASTPTANPLPTAQQATITLNYPALVATPINLSLQGPGGIVTAPSSVTIAAGAMSIPVTLSLIGVPAAGAAATFTLTASIINAIGLPLSAQSQQFTITRAALTPAPVPVPPPATPTPAPTPAPKP
jgi:hypothetical protein